MNIIFAITIEIIETLNMLMNLKGYIFCHNDWSLLTNKPECHWYNTTRI